MLDGGLTVPDDACKRLGDYNYRAPSQEDAGGEGAPMVYVKILDHIFEQSSEDLEAIRAGLEGGKAAPGPRWVW